MLGGHAGRTLETAQRLPASGEKAPVDSLSSTNKVGSGLSLGLHPGKGGSEQYRDWVGRLVEEV